MTGDLARRLLRPVLLWSAAGLLAVLVSLPVLNGLHGLARLGPPPASGVLLLGASVVLAFALGGLIGALVASAAGRRYRSAGCGPAALAALAGLALGGLICSVTLPMYTSSVVDALTREGAQAVYAQRRGALDAAKDAAGTVLRERRLPDAPDLPGAGQTAVNEALRLARNGAARLPALVLLGWILLGPALAAGVEARRRSD